RSASVARRKERIVVRPVARPRKLSAAAGLAVAVLLGATVFLAQPAQAQYFGRNKVQYENFDFKVLRTAHFDLYYYPEERPAADIAARMAERWYARLSAVL